jgi:hypothetical protein
METVMHKRLTNLTTFHAKTSLVLSVFAATMLANSLAAEAQSETQCRAEARQATGEVEGLDFEQALAGCMLDNSRAAVVIERRAKGSRLAILHRVAPNGLTIVKAIAKMSKRKP